MDLDIEEDLIIRREIRKNGSSRSFINDSPVKLDQLKFISQYIMDQVQLEQDYLYCLIIIINYKLHFLKDYH